LEITQNSISIRSAIDEYNISIENIYNMDESGFAIGEVEGAVSIINFHIRARLQRANLGRQEWVTSVECICVNRTAPRWAR
jgi:hypothetical protein